VQKQLALIGFAVAVAVALTVWLLREPHWTAQAAPIAVPKVKRPSKASAAGVGGAPESPETEAPEPETPTMPVGTADLPEQLDRHMLENGMSKAFKAVEKCWDLEHFAGRMRVNVVIDKTGNPKSVQLLEPTMKTQTTDCVVKAVHRNASFPHFRGTLLPTVELSYPFLFKEDGHLGP
jgi:hypothetical protein